MTTELTLDNLRRLYDMAVRCISRGNITPCVWIYRNRWKSYFDEILTTAKNGVMEVYKKDNSGDPASPINGQIKGLFFMAKNINGRPPEDSPFGEIRIQIPADVLLSMAPNLYFVDFYCMSGKTHYVTLVMTKQGSLTDSYCREKLLALDHDNPHDNPFLFRQGSRWYVNVTPYILVELFYTEDINIFEMNNEYGAILRNNIPPPPNCRGRSTLGGKPKNSSCPQCNLALPPANYHTFWNADVVCRRFSAYVKKRCFLILQGKWDIWYAEMRYLLWPAI